VLAAGAVDHHPLYDVGKKTVGIVLWTRQLGAYETVDHGWVKQPVAVVRV
jgi:pterin-4a-carbinolamine dehydratase